MTLKAKILIVDDELIVREDLRDQLEGLGYDVVGTAVSGGEAVAKAVSLRPDLVLMDIKLKDRSDGVAAARTLHERAVSPVVFLTAFADESTIARATAASPYGYLTKPFHDRALRATIEVALQRRREETRPPINSVSRPAADGAALHGLLGVSPAMQRLHEQIARIAPMPTTVLVEGETGTGKERVARALHLASARARRPFVAINCAGLTDGLAASELFGYRRGAFTGAIGDHKGLFEAADGGTLLLDEIGDIPPHQQPFLLRVLEEREVLRIGDHLPRQIDVRVIAASNRNLEDAIASGRFRADLFYRIRVARIVVPPLRERLSDVALLAGHFLEQFAARSHSAPCRVDDGALTMLCAHDWPGNVRELKNAMEHAAVRCHGGIVRRSDLPPEVSARPHVMRALSVTEERERLRAALESTHGNRTEAARLLGISRATFYRRLGESGGDDADCLTPPPETPSVVS